MPRIDPSVICQPVSEGAVLFHTASEVYFGLNEVGHHIWRLLSAAATLDMVYAGVQEAYPDAEAERVRADVDQLIEELAAHELLELTAD